MIGDLNNKSLEPARNKLRAHTFVEYLSKRPGEPITTQFECDKIETKYKF